MTGRARGAYLLRLYIDGAVVRPAAGRPLTTQLHQNCRRSASGGGVRLLCLLRDDDNQVGQRMSSGISSLRLHGLQHRRGIFLFTAEPRHHPAATTLHPPHQPTIRQPTHQPTSFGPFHLKKTTITQLSTPLVHGMRDLDARSTRSPHFAQGIFQRKRRRVGCSSRSSLTRLNLQLC